MRKICAFVACAMLVALSLQADPYIGYCYPAGIQAGTTNRIVVGGQRLWGLNGGWVSGEGIEILNIERVPNFQVPNGKGQQPWLTKWVYSILNGDRKMPPRKVADEALVGWTRCSWWEKMDELDDLKLSMVAHYLFTPRNALQMSPSLAERAIVTVAARHDAKPGMRNLILYDNRGASAPRPFMVSAERHMEEPLYTPPPRKGVYAPTVKPKICAPPIILDGQIMPGETDVFLLSLKKGDKLVCLLTGRELTPYLGDAVPGFFNPVLRLTNKGGEEIAFADDYGYLPDPVLSCQIPSNGVYRLEVRDNLYRGRADFVYSVSCFTDGRQLPSLAERAFAAYPKSLVRKTVQTEGMIVHEGKLPRPGSVAEYDFEVKEPGEWSFELFARRQGSPLDGVVKLFGPLADPSAKKGSLLATWDDVTNTVFVGSVPQAECDPIGRWSFAKPGAYRVQVSDRIGKGGDDYSFTLQMKPSQPSFEVYALKSSFMLPAGKKEKFRFKVRVVRRDGFSGIVRLEGGETFRLKPLTIPAGTNEMVVVAEPLNRDWTGMKTFRLMAYADGAGGRKISVPVVATDEMEQAFAYTHLLPVDDFNVYSRSPDLSPAKCPEWPEMPYDQFLPRRVIRSHAEMSSLGTNYVQALDALALVDVPLIEMPTDVEDGVLAAKFATSAARLRQRGVAYPMVFIPEGSDWSARLAWAVLAGAQRMVDRELNFVDGDADQVRMLARMAMLPHDNDVLVYVPTNSVNPLVGSIGGLARKLRDQGWCFDFVTDNTISRAPCGRIYKAIVLPMGVGALLEETKLKLDEYAKKRNFIVVYDEVNQKRVNRELANKCRRENLPAGIRFARFGNEWGEGWYFVHNPTSTPIAGVWRFAIRGRPRTAFAMDVKTGNVKSLKNSGVGNDMRFDYALEAGASAWIYVTIREKR